MHLNPDHFLETPAGRIWTAELNARAWARCFEELPGALAGASLQGACLYVMVGAQGSGKSTWARTRAQLEPNAVIFDAILVKREERAPVLAVAARHGVRAIAVWLQTPLEDCISRNRSRAADEFADEVGLRNVYAALEPPSVDEGFSSVWRVSSDA